MAGPFFTWHRVNCPANQACRCVSNIASRQAGKKTLQLDADGLPASIRAHSNTPIPPRLVALFTIGAMLARWQINSTSRTPYGRYVPVALMKLIVHPLLVGGVGFSAIALGLPLDSFALTVVMLVAALPSASNVALLAERFGADKRAHCTDYFAVNGAGVFSFSGAVALLV